MKTLAVANQKGGVGKTATIVHLAFDFLERGLRVAVIDIDTQANASYTLGEFRTEYPASHLFSGSPDSVRAAIGPVADEPVLRLIPSDPLLADIEKRPLADATHYFRANVNALAACGFDICLIDTAPSLGIGMAAALYAADFVLSPIELEAYSIQGIQKMVTTIAGIRKINPALTFLGMVPSKVDRRNPRHGRHLEELERAYPQLLVPAAIGLRSSIADALAARLPVWKIRKTAARTAAKEMRGLADLVITKMEIV